MSKQRKAMELALEALEDYQANGAPFFKCDSAVSAIREALYEPARKPLTDEEINSLADKVAKEMVILPVMNFSVWLARAIERAHGIGES